MKNKNFPVLLSTIGLVAVVTTAIVMNNGALFSGAISRIPTKSELKPIDRQTYQIQPQPKAQLQPQEPQVPQEKPEAPTTFGNE
jgi:hypothetical protein